MLKTNNIPWARLEDEQAIVAIGKAELRDHYDDYLTFKDLSPELVELEASKFPESIDGLLRERRFENTISIKVGRTTQLLRFYDETRSQLMHTLSVIDSEMH